MKSIKKVLAPETPIPQSKFFSICYNHDTEKSIKSKKHFPAWGRELNERLRFNNIPFLVIICLGLDCWEHAKQWRLNSHVSILVITPDDELESLKFPVRSCRVIIEWNTGPSEPYIIHLVQILLQAMATVLVLRPLFVDRSIPVWSYDTSKVKGQRWIQAREQIHVYHNSEMRAENEG